jgi:hypothetical protein
MVESFRLAWPSAPHNLSRLDGDGASALEKENIIVCCSAVKKVTVQKQSKEHAEAKPVEMGTLLLSSLAASRDRDRKEGVVPRCRY